MSPRPAAWLALTALLAGVAVMVAAPLSAHTKSQAVREIVRLKGKVQSADQACADRLVTLRILQQSVRLCAAEERRVAVATTDIAAGLQLPAEYEVQGERAELYRATTAKVGDRMTVLAEWRPGRRDLFLIALDICSCSD